MNTFWTPLPEDMSSKDEAATSAPWVASSRLTCGGTTWRAGIRAFSPSSKSFARTSSPAMFCRAANGIRDPEQPSIPQLDDAKFFYGSMGAWRDFMAAIWATHDGIDDGYCNFAWDGPDREGCQTRKLVSSEDVIADVQERMLAEVTEKLEPANDNDPFEGEFWAKVARVPDSSFKGNAD